MRTPRVWAYIRVSSGPQETSLDDQFHFAKLKADELVASKTCVVEPGWALQEIKSASEICYRDRPAFKKLMSLIQRGDHLIIWHRDRLDRNTVERLVCLQWLSRLDVTLHITSDGYSSQVMKSLNDRIINITSALVGEIDTDRRKTGTKAGVDHAKRAGFAWTRYIPWGHRKKRLPPEGKRRRGRVIWIWDETQCVILREIKRLRDDCHWTWQDIGLHLKEDGYKTPNGGEWCVANKTRTHGYIAQQVKLAYDWYTDLLARGLDLGHPLDFTASTKGVRQPSTCVSAVEPSLPEPPQQKPTYTTTFQTS